jgi:hypothetical protein
MTTHSTSTTASSTPTGLTPARLWKRMTAEQRLAAARAFWQSDEAGDDQVQAVLLIAQQKKFRPKTVMGLDEERRSKHLASFASIPETMAARALIVYHLAAQRPMMGAFLDALGIAHENGVIQADDVKPDESKLAASVDQIAGTFPQADVALYLNTLLCQDPETWGGLRPIVEAKGWATA